MREDFWRTLVSWVESGAPCALATVVRTAGSAPRHQGARMLVRQDGTVAGTVGGGALELAVSQAAQEVIASGVPQLLSYKLKTDLGMTCGGAADVFVEPLLPGERLYLFGAGHIGLALAPLAARLGFSVTVIDERPELASPERFPQAAQLVHSFAPERWADLPIGETSYCVVVSPGHKIDTEIVAALLRRNPCRYVGMIGSVRKRRAVEEALRQAGIPEERLAVLHTPIGEPIGAETPEEIAVSIAAELVRARRSAPARPLAPTQE